MLHAVQGLLFAACAAYSDAVKIVQFRARYGRGFEIRGYKPLGMDHPVYLWLTGTNMPFNTLPDQILVKQMAARGFVSGVVEYQNSPYTLNCMDIDDKAALIFQGPNSALEMVCSQSGANCSKGVAVHGFSQGAHLAALAAIYDPRISAELLFGNGNFAFSQDRYLTVAAVRTSTTCLRYHGMPGSGLPKTRRRSIAGAHDYYMGNVTAGVIAQQKITTGYDCGNKTNCIQADGSGYYVVTSPNAIDHMFYLDSWYRLRPAFKSGVEPWDLKPCLDWLSQTAKKINLTIVHQEFESDESKFTTMATEYHFAETMHATAMGSIRGPVDRVPKHLLLGTSYLAMAAGVMVLATIRVRQIVMGSIVACPYFVINPLKFDSIELYSDLEVQDVHQSRPS